MVFQPTRPRSSRTSEFESPKLRLKLFPWALFLVKGTPPLAVEKNPNRPPSPRAVPEVDQIVRLHPHFPSLRPEPAVQTSNHRFPGTKMNN